MPRINSYSETDGYQLAPLFAEETEKAEQGQLYHLVMLETPAPSPDDRILIVDANYDVVFGWGGLEANKGEYTYAKFPVKFSPAEVNTDGSIAKASITIADASRDIMYYVEAFNGLRGCRVHIKTVYANALYYLYSFAADGSVTETPNVSHNPDACLHDEYFIDNYTANEQTVTFQLDPIIDLEIRIPRRRYLVDSCYFEFKNCDTCQYSGPDTECNKNLAACRAKGNQARYGGFPGISGSRKLFL